MEITGDEGRITITPVQAARAAGAPASIEADVSVTVSGFSGRVRSVRFPVEAVAQFVSSLESMDRDRSGAALLRSTSQDELVLGVRVLGRAREIVVSAALRSGTDVGGSRHPLSIEGSFELDAGLLPSIVTAFRKLRDH